MIGIVATRTLLTVEQFEQLSEEEHYRYELDHGELIEVSGPNFEHNDIRGIIEHVFRSYLAKQRLGRVIAEQEFRLDSDTVRRPDVAFLSVETLARFDKTKSILDIVPDLVAEVVSPSDAAEDLMRKVNQFLAAGTKCVWVIYPAERKVHAYEPNDQVRVLGEKKNLESPELLPGFSLPVSQFFE
jgi:Uma2 family endonuclease